MERQDHTDENGRPNMAGPGPAGGGGADAREIVVTIGRDGSVLWQDAAPPTQPGGPPPAAEKPENAPETGAAALSPSEVPPPARRFPTWDDLNSGRQAGAGAGPPAGAPAATPGATGGPEEAGPPSPGGQGASPAAGDGHAPGTHQAGARAAAHDRDVQALLTEVRPGWAAADLDAWLYDKFLATLADLQGLTRPALLRYLDWLIAGLKAAGYAPRKRSSYLSLWKSIAKEKAAERQARQAAEGADREAAGQSLDRFVLRRRTLPGASGPPYHQPFSPDGRRDDAPPLTDFQTLGIFDNEAGAFLSNFTVAIEEEVDFQDEFTPRKLFKGRLRAYGREVPFEIDAKDFADNLKFFAKILEAAGSRAVVDGKMDLVRQAVSALSWAAGAPQPARRVVTTDFGWVPSGDAFLCPGGVVTAGGFSPVTAATGLRVELAEEELARHLDLAPPPGPEALQAIKRHIVEDLLRLHQPRVTYSLLAAVAAALLARFAPATDPFVLWLVGLTGAGKSFISKLFMNFFGDFPVASGRFAAWSATANYIQRQGYFFKDCLYLVDDYKPEVIPHYQVVRILQNFADRTGRGRLKADATTNTTRPVRGLLLSTGEDVPEHTASAVARSVVVEVPQREKDLDRGARCVDASPGYRAVTADFVRHLLAQRRTQAFAASVAARRQRYYKDVAGQQNDSRVASNFALLAAAFAEAVGYFRDVWPGWEIAVERFLEEDLVAVRDGMLGAVREQQASEVFWSVLAALIHNGAVALGGWDHDTKGRPVVGKAVAQPAVSGLCFISTDLALAEVNTCLRAQGRPELKVSHATLLGQLRREGRLLDETGRPLSPDGDDTPTRQPRIGGQPRRAFLTSRGLLAQSLAPQRSVPQPQPEEDRTPW
jgi:hypothetical protein